jgi:hypothetical protein
LKADKSDIHVDVGKRIYDELIKEAESRNLDLSELVRERLTKGNTTSNNVTGQPQQSSKDELGPVGTIYEVEQSPGFPKTLVEKRDLFGAGLKLRKLELERRKIALKEKELEAKTQSGKEAKKQYPAHPCNVEGCTITAHFATAGTYEAHLREYHPERFTEPRGHEAGRWWR